MLTADDLTDIALLPLAVAWDAALGEPPNALHPVVWMGRLARFLERHAPATGAAGQLTYGAVMAAAPPAAYAASVAAAWRALRRVPPVALLVGVPLLKSTFAIGALRRAGEGVRRSLAAGDLPEARLALRSLVSRDPATLAAPLIAAAAVESLAENFGDSIVAPLCYYVLCGLPGAVAYRAINTLDAMIGYRGRYEWLGKAAALLDDLLNLVPARLAAVLLIVAAQLAGEDARNAWLVARRDGRLTASPNSGWAMAAMAGALGVELEKVGHYRLGAGGVVAGVTAIARADRIVGVASGLAVVLAAIGRVFVLRGRRGR